MSGDCCRRLEQKLRAIEAKISQIPTGDFVTQIQMQNALGGYAPLNALNGVVFTGDLKDLVDNTKLNQLRERLEGTLNKKIDITEADRKLSNLRNNLTEDMRNTAERMLRNTPTQQQVEDAREAARKAQQTADVARDGADTAKKVAGNAKSIADTAKETASKGLKVAQDGLRTAGNAFGRANDAFSKATGAIESINFLGSTVGRLASVAFQAFNLAGTAISLYANFVNLRSINALERRIDSIEVGVQTSISLASRGIFMARRLEGELANVRAGLYLEIERVGFTANQGLQKAFQAIEKSAQAFAGAQKALAVGIQASAEAQGAVAQAIAAEQSAQGANAKAVQSAVIAGVAGALAGKALDAAFSAGRQAQTAASAASAATAKADSIARELPPLRQRVADAIGLSTMARSRAENAERLAREALSKAGQPGPRGLQGLPGRDGRPGRDGKPGLQGRPGRDGLPGVQGKPGLAGKPGRDGKPGLNGRDGRDGKDGMTDPTIKPLLLQIKGAQQAHMGQSRANGVQSRQAATAATTASIQAGQANQKVGAVQATANTIATTTATTYQTILDKFTALSNRLKLPEIINAMTFFAVMHNAMFLSRDAVETVGDLMSMGLAAIGLKDENNQPHDINQYVGEGWKQLMVRVFGASQYNSLLKKWQTANRIISSAFNIMYNVRNLFDSAASVGEWTAENVGIIGNALKEARIVRENAYKNMPENFSAGQAQRTRAQKLLDSIDGVEDTASSLYAVTADVVDIQEEFQEVNKSIVAFNQTVQAAQPNPARLENAPVKEASDAAKAESVSSPFNIKLDAFKADSPDISP